MKLSFDSFKRGLLMLGLIALSNLAWSQRTVKGTVTDAENGEPLIGANVLVVGSNTGTVTDLEGMYSIDVPAEATQVEFSYTGYSPQVITLGASNVVDVRLSAGALLDEIVVIGYGAVRKSDLTGSISKVGEEDFNRGNLTSPEQLLTGRVAGVQITNASSAPGSAVNVRVRGVNSIRSGNDPLFVVDGVQLSNSSAFTTNTPTLSDVKQLGRSPNVNPLSFINPSEIESIEVLKDASATAIYGSRGANGVIIITTKKGKSGAPRLDYTVQQGLSNLAQKLEVLSASEFRQAFVEEGITPKDSMASVDAMDEISRTAYQNGHDLSLSGATDKINYRVSVGYLNQEGIILNSGMEKLTGGINTSFKVLPDDRLTIDVGVTTSRVAQENAPVSDNSGYEGSLIGAALQWNPTRSFTLADGSFDQREQSLRNPLAMLSYIKDNFVNNRTLGNLGATFRIVNGLSYKFFYGVDNSTGERRVGVSPDLNFEGILGNGQAIVANVNQSSSQLAHTLNFDRKISSSFSLNALVGYEYLKYTDKGTRIEVDEGLQDVGLDFTDILQSAPRSGQKASSYRLPDVELQSYFARAIFNIQDKYLLTGTIRADGSSKFGENNQYGYFPSFAFAWNLHQESFAPDVFDVLKLRLGYGVTGNQEFPAGSSQENFVFENGALTQKNAANPDLKWESTGQINVGIDFGFMNYRLTGSIDYFDKTTNDPIFFVPLPQPNPSEQGRIWRNLDGTIKNRGVELALNGVIINKSNFDFNLGVNATYITNEISGFSSATNTGSINGQGLTGAFAQRFQNGQPLFAYYLPVFVGFNDAGLSLYEDGNGGTTLIPSAKQFVDADPLPDLLLGITTAFRFGNIDLNINFDGAFGYQIYNNTANAVFVKGNLANGRNITSDLVGNGESFTNSYPASTRYLEDGDHLRLSNMTLGYTFPLSASWFKNLRLYLTGQNLFILTGYSGFDPVVNTNKEIDGIPSFGIEYTPYPTARTFLLGANVSF